jgi:hypothetical protein
MKIERKSVYVAIALVLLVLVSIPSVIFISQLRTYFGFLFAWSDGALRPALSSNARPQEVQSQVRIYPPELRFVRFIFKKAGTREVGIAADFNDWDSKNLPMKEEDKGVWIAVMPLPRGTYKYVFVVDGTQLADPGNPVKDTYNGHEVSVISVQ